MELSKKDKKKAREIIESGLKKEFNNALSEADNILSDWKAGKTDNPDTYHSLYKHIKDFDKLLAWRYDRLSGSKYLFVIAAQLNDGVITENDLIELSDDVQQAVKMIANH